MAGNAYTGQRRRHRTPWSVRAGDAFAGRIIAVGGIGTIGAILLVVLVLLGTALPLLRTPTLKSWHTATVPGYRQTAIDEHGLLMWGMREDGAIEVRELNNGTLLKEFPSLASDSLNVSGSVLSIDKRQLTVGLSDGGYRTATIQFETRLLSPNDLPEQVKVTAQEPVQHFEAAVYSWVDKNTARQTRINDVQWSAPQSLGSSPVVALDYIPDESANRLSANSQSNIIAVVGDKVVYATIRGKRNMMTKKVVETVTSVECDLQRRDNVGRPTAIALLNGNTQALVTWSNGTIDRYAINDGSISLVESQSAFVGKGKVRSAIPLLGRQTLLCGLENGNIVGFMVTRSDSTASASDGARLALAHELTIGDSPVVALASSEQSHLAVAADAAGQTSLIYVTTDSILKQAAIEGLPENQAVQAIGLDPSGTVIFATTNRSISVAAVDVGFPEASFATYFKRVWYEGHDRPKFMWQSTAGTEKSEPKFSMMPLVFGTLKATVYALLISVPLAIMAAIYTSEFLSPSVRSRVKPAVELMASLPSVVLGYIAALVIAPFLQEHLVAILLGLMTLPVLFVFSGALWSLLPAETSVRWQSWRMLGMVACLPAAYFLATKLAPSIEAWLFEGDMVRWLGGTDGNSIGGWMLILLPIVTLIAIVINFGPLAQLMRTFAMSKSPGTYAFVALGKLAATCTLVVGLSWTLGFLLDSAGFDPRDGLFTNYQDRNALLVGCALGFCVIPIIYTISDDALQAVPRQLRSASLGCGATQWQTTMRVVVPSAMSGLFSAVMIGLGRAVGETMVVLMAAGNTPVLEWNPFNGFRTLSATLATELPEAAKGSTHFRTLFLAALILFVLTLFANTIAEFVRMRFRKRASQL